MRERAIAWWPGTIAAGREEMAVAGTMDLFPTALALAGAELPNDRIIDGKNLLPLLKEETSEAIHDVYFYYRGREIYAARKGPWKAHFITELAYVTDTQYTEHEPALLFNLDHDPSEQYDVAAEFPEIITEILADVAEHQAQLIAYPDQLADRSGVTED